MYISQLITIHRICDNFYTFVKRHRLLIERLIRQGFWYNKLCNALMFQKFAKRYNAELSKYNVCIRIHVSEGICIPLEVKHDRARIITFNMTTSPGGGIRDTIIYNCCMHHFIIYPCSMKVSSLINNISK